MDTLVLSATQDMMNSSGDSRGIGGTTRSACHHHHYRQQQQLDYVQAIEEYVLDEHNLNALQLFSMPLERRHQDIKSTTNIQHQQPPPPPPPSTAHHVRRSAELRTVSIIETLSELVSRTDNGYRLGNQHACDGQCSGECGANSTTTSKTVWNTNGNNGITHLCCSPTCKQFSIGNSCCHAMEKTTSKETFNGEFAHRKSTNCCNCKDCSDLVSLSPPPPPPPLPLMHLQQQQQATQVVSQGQLVAPVANNWPLENVNSVTKSRGGKLFTSAKSVDNVKGENSSCATTKHQFNTSNKRREKGSCGGGGGRMTVSRLKKKTVNALLPSAAGGGRDTRSGKNVNGGDISAACSNGHTVNSSNQNCSLLHQKDSNRFMLSTLKSKGRTPDWIAGIFSIARRGNLEKLIQALVDMDATLIRNLSDHRGNNLFHVCCCFGHLECLQWLMQRGKQCEDAILDENKYELTPLVCAVKYGKLPCVEWLITNSIARGQLVPSNGGRPLLHWAAKYGQEVILRWLAKFMENNDMGVNVKDGYGNTALHLAAKHGHAVSIKALITHRCDVSLKNDLGYKASDYAILYGQTTCSEYLLSLEACLMLSSDVASLDSDLNSTKTEMTEMKTQFKEVLTCAKKLVKEREELSQHLDQLQDGLVHLNNVLIGEIQALCEENKQLRSGSAGNLGIIAAHSHSTLDETVALCHAMHTRWQEGQQRWFSPSALAEIQQKILLAEERWKRARARVTWGDKETKDHMDVFRERLAQVQCRTTGIRLSDIRSVSSSESSLASMEEDTLSDYEDRCELPATAISSRTNPSGCPDCCCTCHEWKFFENNCYQQPPPPPPPPNLNFNESKSLVSSPSTKQAGNKRQTNKHLQESANILNLKRNTTLNRACNVNLVSEGTCKVLEVIATPATSNLKEKDVHLNGKSDSLIELFNGGTVSHPPPWSICNSSYVEFSAKEEFPSSSNSKVKVADISSRKTQKSNNNDCKSEQNKTDKRDDTNSGDEDDDRNFSRGVDGRSRLFDQQQRPTLNSSDSKNTSSSKNDSKSGTVQSSSAGGSTERNRTELNTSENVSVPNGNCNASSNVASTSSSSFGKLVFSEPDLIMGTKGVRNNDAIAVLKVQENYNKNGGHSSNKTTELKQNRTAVDVFTSAGSMGSVVVDGDSGQLPICFDKIEDAVEDEEATPLLAQHEVEKLNLSTNCEDSQSQPCCSNISLNSGGGPLARRKGFLQKLNLRWPSKRAKPTAKPSKKGQGQPQEITPEDFRETYMHLNRSNCGDETGASEADVCDSTTSLLNHEVSTAANKVLKINKDAAKELLDKSFSTSGSVEGVQSSKQKAKSFASTELDDQSKKHNSVSESNAVTSSAISNTITCNELVLTPPVPPPNKPDVPVTPCPIPARTNKRDVPIPPVPFNHRDLPMLPDISGMRVSSDVQKASIDSNVNKNSSNTVSNAARAVEETNESRDVDEDELPCSKKEDGDSSSQTLDREGESRVIENLPENSHSVHTSASFSPQRPASLSTKSVDMNCPLSRPESSASRSEPTYLAFRHLPGFPLHKVASMSTDLLTSDSLTPSRMSPAPSEVSKTESALSPPSDISKTESMRHLRQLTRIEENISNRESRPLPALPIRRYDDVKRANIVDISAVEIQKQSNHKQQISFEGSNSQEFIESVSKDRMSVDEGHTLIREKTKSGANTGSNTTKRSKSSKEEKPWYDLSDDEEILMADVRLRNTDMVKHGSSEDEEAYFCT
ncbi:hypothetical protein CHUAL_011018 [Chamberlinius hualienensis]